jgi:hypothetical protein
MRTRSFTLVGAAVTIALLCSVLIASASAQAPAGACPPAPATAPAQPAPSGAQPAPEQIIACIGTQPITGATFLHWLGVAGKADEPASKHSPATHSTLVNQVIGFLVSSDWVLGEAQELHIVISEAKVHRTFDHIRRQQFPKRKEFTAFLRSSGQTVADLLFRVHLNLLSARIQRQVVAGHHGARSQRQALSRFVREFKTRWTARTYCEPAYADADCGHVQSGL